ncbi:MAG TPA: SDR family oxidoreductase [Chitinophagaceae bacterium]|nr:SDR family oxidoreductase [Chitinophagaceae bacterium]
MEKIIVFGATGGTGKFVVEQALQAGYQVTMLVRDPDAVTILHPNLEKIKGDVFQPLTFENALKEKDIVVSCLGTRKRVPSTVYSEGINNITKAMKKAGLNRIICISAGAVIVPPKSSFLLKFITAHILQRLFKHIYADMLLMEKKLSESNLNWTIIRAPWLRNTRYTGKYRSIINEHLQDPSKISRADLADYIVKHLTDKNTFQARIEISY